MSTTKQLLEEGFRGFVGVVADIADPQQLGRVRVRIFGTHDDTNNISDEDLPWAQVLVSPTSASLSGVGRSPTGIAPNSFVIGVFLDGMEGQFPLILGTFHKMPNKDPNQSDVNILARGTNKLNKKLTGPEPKSPYKAQYPKNQVFESKTGHIIEIDDTDGDERIHIYHRKGTYIEIDKDGRLVIKSVDSTIDVADKDKTIYAKGTIKIESEKSIELKAKDNITLTAKNVKISGGTSTIKMASGILGVNSGNIKMTGDYVKVDSPISKISGASIQSGKVAAKNVVAKKVTAKGMSSSVTGGLAAALGGITNTVGNLGNLGALPDVATLGSALDNVFGSFSNSLTQITNEIADSTINKVRGVIDQVDNAIDNIESATASVDNTIDQAFESFDSQINNKISSDLNIDVSNELKSLTDSTETVWT